MDMRGVKAALVLLILIGLGCGTALAADELAGASQGVEKPSVSRLRAAIEGDSIVLSWNGSGNSGTACIVYRSRTPFSPETMEKAQRLGSVDAGAGQYSDSPPAGMDWYYLVLVLDKDGLPAQVFLPMQTMTKVPLRIELPANVGKTETAPPSPTRNVKAEAPRMESQAGKQASQVAAPPPAQEKIADSLKPASLETEKAAEKPVALPLPGDNIPVDVDERDAPLPIFLFNSGIPTSNAQDDLAHGEAASLDPEAEKAAQALLAAGREGGPPPPSIQVIPARDAVAGEDDLVLIAQGIMKGRDWASGRDRLKAYLEGRHAELDKARASYYLGICLVELGSLDEGIYHLLRARDAFPVEAKPWIDYATDLLGGR